jgi:hypothetical protein
MQRVLIWTDGSSDTIFKDGSVIVLNKKMHKFYYISTSNDKNINTSHSCIQMYTSFATLQKYDGTYSNTDNIRNKLLQVLHFVNAHVAEPFLCLPNVPVSMKETFTSDVYIDSTVWQFHSDNIKLLASGAVQCISEDGKCVFVLYPNGQLFKVTYPALINDTTKQLHDRYLYTHVTQYYSIHDYPTIYLLPLQIALYYYRKRFNLIDTSHPINIQYGVYYTTKLPLTKQPNPTDDETDINNSINQTTMIQRAQYLKSMLVCSNEELFLPIVSPLLAQKDSNIYLEYIVDSNLLYRHISSTEQSELVLQEDNSTILSFNKNNYFIHYMYNEDGPYEKVYHQLQSQTNLKSFNFDAEQQISKIYPISRLLENLQKFHNKAQSISKISFVSDDQNY